MDHSMSIVIWLDWFCRPTLLLSDSTRLAVLFTSASMIGQPAHQHIVSLSGRVFSKKKFERIGKCNQCEFATVLASLVDTHDKNTHDVAF